MGRKKNTYQIYREDVFDIDLPEINYSFDSVFAELKGELKEGSIRNSKKIKKRAPPKPKKTVVEQKHTLRSVEDIASKLDRLERTHPTITENTNDPLALSNTPEYMTQREFQKHYKLLLDRVQIQLGSLGGGGAVAIRDMEDVETAFITDPATLDGATMKMRYNSTQKVLEFYGDNTTLLDQRTISGTADINVNFLNNNFEISLSESITLPGTLNTIGITSLASSGADTNIGGDILVTGMAKATKFTTTSDERLKTNIAKIEDPLEVISHLEGVKFNWIADGSDDVGLIAQDVERCLPEAVTEHKDVKSVNYNGVVGLLVESVKELSKDNQLLRMEIESLKRRL
ncbi:hypothetical protein S420910_164 [Synechococcus phage S-CAM7]|uniref:Peptidase S74 domain-containing protein n=1 Tax=Synechococcus phage S-CAM7 TaxID=1883368 RepID=A0A1D8KUQ3_9CAUD|nr:hypothetical protein S420910_164 [Synechococcus phage S-CAM7]